MDKFFWLEVTLPILITGLFSLAVTSLFRKFQKRGYLWGALHSAIALLFLVFTWIVVCRYANSIQCEAAYGDLASDPKMCDNPAGGMALILQFPLMVIAWISVSVFSLVRLKPLKLQTA